MKKFRVFGLDVQRNENDGFEVNDRSQLGTIDLPLDMTDTNEICEKLNSIIKSLNNL